ncbi:MAG TPA: type II toxin-antitoxin system RelE/ParE family toxin [Steroidobacteraceae bacterium]
MRRAIRKSALAELDLISIWEYSFGQWDAIQADKYLDDLDNGIGALADNPELGVSRDVVRAGYRALLINHHAVYYTITQGAIYIVRVLHEGMDPGRHL